MIPEETKIIVVAETMENNDSLTPSDLKLMKAIKSGRRKLMTGVRYGRTVSTVTNIREHVLSQTFFLLTGFSLGPTSEKPVLTVIISTTE